MILRDEDLTLIMSQLRDKMILIFGIFAVSSSSFIVLASTEAGKPIDRYTLAFSRVLITGVISFFILGRGKVRWREHILTVKGSGGILLAGFTLAFHFAFWFISLDSLPVGVSLALTNTAPIWMLLITHVIYNERPRSREWIALILAFLGILALGQKDFSISGDIGEYTLGVIYALVSGIALAVYLIVARWGVRTIGLWSYFGLVNLTAALTLLVTIIARGQLGSITPHALFFGLLLALLPGLLGHASFQYSMSKLPTSMVGSATLGEPVLGAIIAWILLSQGLSVIEFVGIVIIISGISFNVFWQDSVSP